MRHRELSWRGFASSKVRRLLIPFIVLTLVTFIPRSLLSSMADSAFNIDFETLLHSFIYTDCLVIPFFWFLQASFILLLLTYAILIISKKLRLKDAWIFTGIIVLFAILPYLPVSYPNFFSLHKAVSLGIYFVAGAAYARYANNIDRFVSWDSIMFFIVMATLWLLSYFLLKDTQFLVFCSFAGIAMCISTAKLLVKYNITILDRLIGSNYIIFLLSWYFNIASQQVLHHYTDMPWWIYTIMSIFAGIFGPWLIYRYMYNHPDSPVTKFGIKYLGQSFKRNRN